MKSRTLRGAAATAIGALGLGLAAAAGADQGNALLESKADGVVVMNGGTVYRVSDSTVLESKEGNRMTFAELPTLATGASADDAAVWFEASDGETQPLVHLLKLTGATPK